MTSPLLSTKLYIPSLRSSLVRRSRLIEELNQGMGCKLILISAAAGFGKTTLLSEWLHQAKMPVGWVSLDEGDNEPSRFWTYLIAALQQSHSEIGKSTLAMLSSTEATSFESFLIPLINDIANNKDDFILVLDDYHLITADCIHQALAFLLDYLPPQLHLAITSRQDPPLPLARLRARSQLTELRTADLQFSVTEADAFINQSMKLNLSQQQVETIQTRTEGWIAGLQLVGLSVRDVDDITTFIESLKGQERYILDYLVEEVLERQPQPMQSFLLRTSILSSMCGSLCEAVVGKNSSVDGREILEQLEHRNLFIVPLDSYRNWYRYHHLFGELLRHQLNRIEPNHILEYHSRAAKWYEQNGFVIEAIEHAIAASEFNWAANLIEGEVRTINSPLEYSLMLKWLEALPRELVWTRPWLSLAYGWALIFLSQPEASAAAVQNTECLLEKQQQDFSPTDTEVIRGLIATAKGAYARQKGDMAEAIAFSEKALELLPQDDSPIRAMVLQNLGVTYFVTDNFEPAQRVLTEATRIGQKKGIADPAIAGLYLQGQFLTLRGQIDKATVLCQQALYLTKKHSWLTTYAGVAVQVAMGELLREQNQLEAAVDHLTESIKRGVDNKQPTVMMGYITLARVRQAQGNIEGAWEAIRAAEEFPTWMWPTILSVPACKARLYLAQGNLDAAITLAENSGLGVDDQLVPTILAIPLTLLFGKIRLLRLGKVNVDNSQQMSIPEDLLEILNQ
jgi:LuxR family transcriptional regulator, maltose regulon positive regulatory protein